MHDSGVQVMALILLTFRVASTDLGKDGNQDYEECKGWHSCHAVQQPLDFKELSLQMV